MIDAVILSASLPPFFCLVYDRFFAFLAIIWVLAVFDLSCWQYDWLMDRFTGDWIAYIQRDLVCRFDDDPRALFDDRQ